MMMNNIIWSKNAIFNLSTATWVLITWSALFISSGVSSSARAETFVLPPPGVDLVGEVRITYARYEDTLMDIARRHGLGYDEILQANPGVDRWIPGEGTPVILPTRYILPDAPRRGIVLNLPEKRLYYFPPTASGNKPIVITHPIGIGRMDWETPLGQTKVVRKTENPTWRPPASIKAEHLELYGEILPDVVPAGPNNPLGLHAMYLGISGYLIHGTNKRDGVGSRVSHGCVRMYPENIAELYYQVPVGTPVRIINQPVKVGWYAGSLFLEAHAPFEDERAPNQATFDEAYRMLMDKIGVYGSLAVEPASIQVVIQQASGLPAPVIN